MIDELNFVGNFDTGWYDPFHHELGVTLSDLVISQPFLFLLMREMKNSQSPQIPVMHPSKKILGLNMRRIQIPVARLSLLKIREAQVPNLLQGVTAC